MVAHRPFQVVYLVVYIAVTMTVILVMVFPTWVFFLTKLFDTDARDDIDTRMLLGIDFPG
jgi:hypothetical protein